MKVPFLDLKAQYLPLKEDIAQALEAVLEKTAFAGGPFVAEFEEGFAQFCDSKFSMGVSSGTSALWLAMLGLDIGPGDEVITVPHTFIATAEAISFTGATPVFVDIDPVTYTMNPALIEEKITSKTKAIIPVHLYGQMADMDPILDIAKKHGLYVIEDACQAHGASYNGHKAGSMGDAGCFSFYAGKNLGAYGEAGAIITQNEEFANKIKMLRDHGQSQKYYHDYVGWNGRMDGFQGAILGVKLKHLADWNQARQKNANHYSELLKDIKGIETPNAAENREHVYHLYVIRTQQRERLMQALKEKDIFCGIHYPIPVHLTKAYEHLGYKKGDFPGTEKAADEILSFPMFPELTEEQIAFACEQVRDLM